MGTQGGAMKVTSINGVKMYAVSGLKSYPSWVPPKKKKVLRKDDQYLRRIDLIQDLGMSTASSRIKQTSDGEYLIVTGTYPPQVKVYELSQLSLKFERHLVAEIIDFQILTEDYSKIAFLCADRSLCLHAKYGGHYSLRIPRMGRDLAYDKWSCDLVCASSSPELYRINLEQGQFLSPLSSTSPAVNVLGRSPVHGLLACGGEDGLLECFDLREKCAVGKLDVASQLGDVDDEVTSLRFDETEGFNIAVGTSSGKVAIYDLRSSLPLRIKDHMYGSPIIDIKWHHTLNSPKSMIVTADKKVIRVWDPDTGDSMASIEPSGGDVNDVCAVKNSGLLLMALDSPQITSFFIPSLGPAPKWCSYLENLTEELEEGGQSSIYEDYKFVTKEDLEELNLGNLIGTNLLRAYMHGFFVDYRLYQKAKALADPFAYEAYRKKRVEEKMEAERAARITIKRRLPKVNQDLAVRLLQNDEREVDTGDDEKVENKKKKKKKKTGSELLKDERFQSLFNDEAFAVDENSAEFLALHPNGPILAKKHPLSFIEEHFEPVEDDAEDGDGLSEANHFYEKDSHKDELDGKKNKKPKFYEIKDERHAKAFDEKKSLASEQVLSLEERIAAEEKKGKSNDMVRGVGGSREISFVSRSLSEGKSDDEFRKKRGVQSLNLKPDSNSFRGRGGGRGRGRGFSPGRGRGFSPGRGRGSRTGRGRGSSGGRGRGSGCNKF